MIESILALPVSVEQVAVAIKQMSQADQLHLLDLVPRLRQLASQLSSRRAEEAQVTVSQLRKKVLAAVNNHLLLPDEPFFGNLTLRQYHALPDEEKAKLWEQWAETDIMNITEREVSSDAVSAG